MTDEKNLESEQSYSAEGQKQEAVEQKTNKAVESGPENAEENLIRGAEMLETPAGGGFLLGIQAFVTWVQSLIK
jgi:hypothetical protein